MPYEFQNWIILRDRTLDSPDSDRVLHESGAETVTLSSESSQTGFNGSRWLMLRGKGYASADVALKAGKLWRHQLSVAFVNAGLAAEFDARLMHNGPPIAPEAPGLFISPQRIEQQIRVNAGWPTIRVTKNVDAFISEDIHKARELIPEGLSPRLELAYATYHAALGVNNAEIRYIMFLTAIEALIPDIKPEKDNKEIVAAIRQLQSEIGRFEWKNDVQRQITDLLGRAREESITRLGKDLAAQLGSNKYDGKSARRFFDDTYGGRSALVHGNTSESERPTPAEIQRRLLEIRRFVLDLLKYETTKTRAGT